MPVKIGNAKTYETILPASKQVEMSILVLESKIVMKNKEQKQEATNGSSAIQAGGDVNITNAGLTYSEVKEVALDVFRANFYELAGLAKQTARDRAEEITEDFLSKLQSENPSGFQKSQDPDFQTELHGFHIET